MSLSFCRRGLHTEPYHTDAVLPELQAVRCSCRGDAEVEGGLLITTSVGEGVSAGPWFVIPVLALA